mgnify:CR=1 FL=1
MRVCGSVMPRYQERYDATPGVSWQAYPSAGKGFRPVDIWLGKNIWMKYIHYPNIFIDMDDSVTQVNSPKGHQKADFYICEYMRRAAAEQSIRLSKRGSSSLLD